MCFAAINRKQFQSGLCLRGLFCMGNACAIIYCCFCFKVKYSPVDSAQTGLPPQVEKSSSLIGLCVVDRGRETASNLAAAVGWKRRSEWSNLAACQCVCVDERKRVHVFCVIWAAIHLRKIIWLLFRTHGLGPISKSEASKCLFVARQTYWPALLYNN